MKPTARALASDILHQAQTRKAFASDTLDEYLRPALGVSPQDRRFIMQLVYGVLRRRGTLDALLTPFVQRPQHAVEPRVWDLLRLGAYQLVFLTHVPPHAAVHETVELAKHVGSRMARGFLNGVLRRVSELVTPEYVEAPGPDRVPVEGGRYRVLARPVLPDPMQDSIGYVAAACSWPRWLAERWHARLGLEECLRLGFWFNATPPLWLRINKLHGDRETYRLRLAAALIESEPGEHPQSLRLTDGAAIRDLPGYAEGDFTVQDLSAMAVASVLNPQSGMTILDLCAAPGGKTTHLAELMGNRGKIIACDIEQPRLDTVKTLCQRLGISIVEPVLLGKEEAPPAGPFSAALLDVPCSNTGVLGRRPEVRWRLKPQEFEHLIRLQTRLLFSAIERVRPGGVIVYSTCSIEPDENQGVVQGVRRAIKGLKLEAEHTSIPGAPGDGGYWARLRKPE